MSSSSAPSRCFTGFRALGYVSNHVPLVTRYHKRHKDNYVITCVGQVFHVYNVSKLGIVAVSDYHPADINVMAADFRNVYTATGNTIHRVTRNKKIDAEFAGHGAEVTLLMPFGPHLVSVDASGTMIVWDISSQEQYLSTKFDPVSFAVTAICHPHTYVNKILLGSQQGSMQLWNLRSNKLIYSFLGWGAAITVIEQAPAIDVVGIGLCDGRIFLHNIKADRTVMSLHQDTGPVTRLSFRTDGHPMMVTGSASGHIALWDLENRKLHSYMKAAHSASVTGLQCLPSEPLMVTSGADNSLKVWIFDLSDGGARLLRSREGHSAPPTRLRFYGGDGGTVLSAGQDSTVRSFSTVHDSYNKSLGRASYNKKASKKLGLKLDTYQMPPVISFAAESNRSSDWPTMICAHRGESAVSTWSVQKGCMGAHFLGGSGQAIKGGERRKGRGTATCVDVSSCGNYAVIGYDSGHVDKYNLQSGKYRGSYQEENSKKAHKSTVRGVCCDGLNQRLVTAGSQGDLCFWRFKGHDLLGKVKLEAFVSQLVLHRESSMLAICLDDFTVHVCDIDTRRIVRKFSGHSAAITDMTFRSDGRWLVTSSMDCTIRTWNMLTGRLIDAFLVSSAPVSVTFAPSDVFLATCHVGDVGVYLWANHTLYTHATLADLPDDFEPSEVNLPGTAVASDDEENTPLSDDTDVHEWKSCDQIRDEMVTLALLPTSRWLNLLSLDVIQMRNKPKEPPKAPKKAPFFLPTVAGLETKWDLSEGDKTEGKIRKTLPENAAMSDLSLQLIQAAANDNYLPVMTHLKTLGPSAVDAEIRSLGAGQGGSSEVMGHFLCACHAWLGSHRDFELVHAYLGLFLKVHGPDITSDPSLTSKLSEVHTAVGGAWGRVQTMMQRAQGLVTYLRTATI